MKENSAGKAALECMICGTVCSSIYKYHKHNIREHTLPQLSRAILRLKNLPVPLNDPPADGDESEEEVTRREEQRQGSNVDMAETLGLALKVELMDEEVIELGPTDNADNLQIQSRLVKNLHERNQQSRQIIEVKENNPPPCYINPAIEDPDAIVVKFNRELVMAQDKGRPLVYTEDCNLKNRPINRQMRAVVKRTIDIPNPKAFIMDYKRVMSRSNDKYVMQNVNITDNLCKKRRGRPRKKAENSDYFPPKTISRKKLEKEFEFSEDEDDLEGLVDPPLFSEDEEEEAAAAIPSITRTRSGRAIKIKKEDGNFKYYDMPLRYQLDTEELSSPKDWTEDSVPLMTRWGKRRRKCKQVNECAVDKPDPVIKIEICEDYQSKDTNDREKSFNVKTETSNECSINIGEGLSMPANNQIADDSNEFDRSSVSESFDGFECFLCFKAFTFKEDCEKHIHEHLSKVVAESNETTDGSSHEFDGVAKVLDYSDDISIRVTDNVSLISSKESDNDTAPITDMYIKDHDPTTPDIVIQPSTKYMESFTCSICNEDFESQTALQEHTHESIYTCKFCGKKYQNRINLQSHTKRYHEETDWMKFKCATCGKNFGFLTALERHMKEHNPNKKFCCEQCGKVFKSLTNLKHHIPLHTRDEVYECSFCPKKYYIRYSFEKHFKTHVSAPKFHCEICDKHFIEKKQFEVHLERHQTGGSLGRSKDLKCNNCGDIRTPSELELVSETDSGHHKKCLVCGKGLYKIYMIENVDVSFQTKSDKLREQCKICGKSVLNLQRHVKYTHLENEYVPCDICGLVVTKASLPSHKNRKHGGSAVTCDHCNRVFKNIMCLREHMTKVRRKADPTKNVCKFCKEMVAPEFWKDHMMKHRTKCNDCGASNFPTHVEFMAHLETCRRCSNCGTTDFTSRGEFLAHIEVCGSSIDIMTGTLDSSNDQEVVTSIFAIVDDSTCCETCGDVFESQGSLSHHITEAHPNALSSSHILHQNTMIDEAILYACPQESCEVIVTSKELLKDHISSIHDTQIENLDNFT
nr:zinc finger protein 532-like isoform X2 [Procambarus clarkii]XP_045602316.1 zinc finger protein 532-like isoform X2 [Procambarus clarkii]